MIDQADTTTRIRRTKSNSHRPTKWFQSMINSRTIIDGICKGTKKEIRYTSTMINHQFEKARSSRNHMQVQANKIVEATVQRRKASNESSVTTNRPCIDRRYNDNKFKAAVGN